jgi:hypothetical protein
MDPEHYDGGVTEPGGNGCMNNGFDEASITHPYVINTNANTTGSRFETDPYPRAIINRSISYNADFSACCPTAGAAATGVPQLEYMAATMGINATSLETTPINATDPTSTFVNLFPLLPLSITPSIAIYKQQQSRFAHFRQRFITATVTPYYIPNLINTSWGATY